MLPKKQSACGHSNPHNAEAGLGVRHAWFGMSPIPTPHCARLSDFGSGAFVHIADFHRVIPKATPRAKPMLGHAATSSTGQPQELQRSEHQHLPNHSGWFGADAAKRVQSITESTTTWVCGSQVRRELQPDPRHVQGSLQTLSPDLMGFWVPIFSPLKSFQISCLHKPQKLLKSDQVTPGFTPKPG